MSWYNPLSWNDESQSSKDKRNDLNNQGGMSSWFADDAQGRFGALGNEAAQSRDYLRQVASGQHSVSGEQLRQGLQQNLAAQRSMAASAAPRDASMAARTAAINAGRLGAGMSGQAALAGLQERRDAQSQLAQMILNQRQQDLNAALGSRQNAISAYGGVSPAPSALQKAQPLLNAAAGIGAVAMSDKRVKHEIEDGEDEAERILDGLKAYKYRYKDEAHGKGRQFGPMAQDMERAGLGHAVIETPRGKAIDGAKAALSGLALTASLAKRVSKLEGGSKK